MPRSARSRHHNRGHPSAAASAYIGRKIRKNIEEGYPPKQAVAIAYSQARKKGYKNIAKVPRSWHKRRG